MTNMILLQNGTLIDGTGAPSYEGDLLMEDDRIRQIGRIAPPPACRVIDCGGLAVAPGFIDVHSHSDLQVLEDRREKSDQGVTAEVVGNCGFSPYPCGDRRALQDFANGILCGGRDWGWATAREYLDEVRRKSKLVHVASLAGHGSLRIAQAGPQQGPLAPRDLDAMEQKLSEDLSDGACGFSTGLMYAPGSGAPFEELLRLCRVVARHGKIYTTHMRSYSWDLLESIDEQLELAKQSGCRLQISHLQTVGRANWDKQPQAIEKIEQARREGLDVAFDSYPYVAGSTVMTQLLPQWTLDGGIPALLGLLSNAARRKEIAAEMRDQTAQQWSDIFVSAVGSQQNQALVGENIAEIAEMRGREPADVVMDLIVEENAAVNMLSFNQNEENLRQLLTHPLCIVISDGFYVKGKPHPRLYGTFPLLLGEYCRERQWLSLPEAVHKMTGMPAQRFGFKNRGTIAPGNWADITVFDPQSIMGSNDYEQPETPPKGIRMVFREGRVVRGAIPPEPAMNA